jgi:hypothetical protein
VEQQGQNVVVVLFGPVHPPTGAQPALPKHDSQTAKPDSSLRTVYLRALCMIR